LVLKNLRTQLPVPFGVWAECIHVSFRAPATLAGGGSGDCLTHQECLGVTFVEPWWVVEVSTGGVRLTTIGYVSGRSFLRPFRRTRFESDAISWEGRVLGDQLVES